MKSNHKMQKRVDHHSKSESTKKPSIFINDAQKIFETYLVCNYIKIIDVAVQHSSSVEYSV